MNFYVYNSTAGISLSLQSWLCVKIDQTLLSCHCRNMYGHRNSKHENECDPWQWQMLQYLLHNSSDFRYCRIHGQFFLQTSIFLCANFVFYFYKISTKHFTNASSTLSFVCKNINSEILWTPVSYKTKSKPSAREKTWRCCSKATFLIKYNYLFRSPYLYRRSSFVAFRIVKCRLN